MQAGKLRDYITIEHQTKARNAIGEVENAWATFCSCWAAIEPASGNTYYNAKQLDSKVDGRIRIRYRDGVKPTMRVKYGDRYFTIISLVQPQNTKRELHLMYSEGLD